VRSDLEPETIASIQIQGVDEDSTLSWTAVSYRCGCLLRHEKWATCHYHDGFDDGISEAKGKGWTAPNLAALNPQATTGTGGDSS
jgi:hypothetical protein